MNWKRNFIVTAWVHMGVITAESLTLGILGKESSYVKLLDKCNYKQLFF